MRKALVIQTAFLGDAILTLPMIQFFKSKNPSYEINVVCIPATKEVFEKSPFVNKVFVLDKHGKERNIYSLLNLAQKIKKEKIDLIISPHRSARSSLLTFLIRASDSVTFDKSTLSFLYKRRVKYNLSEHEVLRNLHLVDFSNSNWKIFPLIDYSIEEKSRVDNFLSIHFDESNAHCAVAPGSVWETKKVPQSLVEEIIGKLRERSVTIFLIGGKEDKLLCENIAVKFDEKVISFAGELNVAETTYLLSKCNLLITNDSAPTHIGMAAQIPVFTIYCSTVPEFGFFPYSLNSRTFGVENLKCKPCGIHGHDKCPIGTFECGYKLNVQEIIDKVEELI